MNRPGLLAFAGILIILGLAMNRHEIMTRPQTVAELDLAAPVILYSTSWCPYCVKAREWFERHEVEYVEYDVEKSVAAATQYRQLRGRGTPLIVMGDDVIQGFNPPRMELALRVLNAQGTTDPSSR
ncbi:MAG: glutaredoxin family protein [Gammaproteobacteria bacterium]|nr:glutaredoxin family protein [Gammaproteobacteria bacterium]MCP5135782.1 glutaredoxin family protein [Gammaproteobacteria bacterium]